MRRIISVWIISVAALISIKKFSLVLQCVPVNSGEVRLCQSWFSICLVFICKFLFSTVHIHMHVLIDVFLSDNSAGR